MSPPTVPGPEDTYEVKEIPKVKRSRGKRYYLIDWKCFGPEERSWEPAENIDAPELLRKFHRRLALKKRRPKGGGTVTNCAAAHTHAC